MKKQVRSIAVTSAVAVFFVMACIGCFKELAPATCCSRALAGAIIAYIAVSLSARAIVAVIVGEIIESRVNKLIEENKE